MEMAVIAWLLAHWGTVGGTLSLIVLLAIRFGPQYVQALRERRIATQQRRIDEQRVVSQREHDLFARIDRKDEILEKLTGNHIQHLELQLAASREFYGAATERLTMISTEMKEVRRELEYLHAFASDSKNDLQYLKGRSS